MFSTGRTGKKTNKNFDLGRKTTTFYGTCGEKYSTHSIDGARKIFPKMDSPDIGAMKVFFQKCYISFTYKVISYQSLSVLGKRRFFIILFQKIETDKTTLSCNFLSRRDITLLEEDFHSSYIRRTHLGENFGRFRRISWWAQHSNYL